MPPFLKLLVEPKDPKRIVPREREDGRVDHYNVESIENVLIGQVLGIISETKDGEGIYLEGDPSSLAGENTSVTKDGKSIISLVNGYVVIEGGKLCVKDTYEVEDVDFKTSNVTFVGRLVVKGSIRKGFSAIANEIVVFGDIEDAHVKATNGISVRGGIVGARTFGIESFSLIKAGWIQESLVIARSNIYVKKGIFNSEVLSGESVLVDGEIVGGHIRAKDIIVAKEIGGHGLSLVELSVGIDPTLEREEKDLLDKLGILERRFDELEKIVNYLSGKGKLSAKEKMELIKAKSDMVSLRRTIGKRKKELEDVRERLKKVSPNPYIRVWGNLYQGVRVNILGSSIDIEKNMKDVKIYFRDGKIIVEENFGTKGGQET